MYQDQTLRCRDCGQDFIFTGGEQEFYASRDLTNPPSRCPDCRAQRKAANGSGYNSGGSYQRSERQMYDVVCASCGKATQVPFQPREDRPVYCSECFERQGGGKRRSSRY